MDLVNVNVVATELAAAPLGVRDIGRLAVACLKLEVATWPKPGLVSHVDAGAHDDMDAALLETSADALLPFFVALAGAGRASSGMDRLRAIGLDAERAMLTATGGVNTHRGAIFGLGLLCAAGGLRIAGRARGSLGRCVAGRWGEEILRGPVTAHSHGAEVARRHGAGGARVEAAAGFPSVYQHALPAIAAGRRLAPGDDEAARVHACLALVAVVADSNLLYRGGEEGLAFARGEARRFLERGGVGARDWRREAEGIHQRFVARRLSPGGCADLLAMALFVDRVGA